MTNPIIKIDTIKEKQLCEAHSELSNKLCQENIKLQKEIDDRKQREKEIKREAGKIVGITNKKKY